MPTTTQRLNIDTLTTAHEAQPDTTHQRKAWLWLAEQDAFRFVGAALVVDSATWERTSYLTVAGSCTCKAGTRPCWHKSAFVTVAAAMTEDARYDALAAQDEYAAPVLAPVSRPKRTAAEKARITAEALELFA